MRKNKLSIIESLEWYNNDLNIEWSHRKVVRDNYNFRLKELIKLKA